VSGRGSASFGARIQALAHGCFSHRWSVERLALRFWSALCEPFRELPKVIPEQHAIIRGGARLDLIRPLGYGRGMNWFLSLWLACQSTPAEAQGLQETAPAYLTQASAAQHLGAARIAGGWYNVDPVMLLSMTHHESRFVVDLQTPESGGRVSCGVMTPEPKERCEATELTLLGGYLAGAAHLRTWIDVCQAADHGRHDTDDEVIQRCALWAYAGGRHFHAYCVAHPGRAGCDAVDKFEERARIIRRALGGAL